MSDSSPVTETWIDRIATDFDRAWHGGRNPQIEDYLGEAPEPEPRLFTELLRIELQHRKRLGESPTTGEYRRRFAVHADTVDPAFRAEGLPVTPPDEPPPTVTHQPKGPAGTDHDPAITYSYRKPDGRVEPVIRPEDHSTLRRDFPPGTVLQNRYIIQNELGHGGMGLVYRGCDSRLGGRPVAIKVILPDKQHGSVAGAYARAFEEEARLGANLIHPAIATVHDFGLHGEMPFTVFEHVGGPTLREVLSQRGRLPLEEVQLILGPLAQAIDYAHAHGVVHRDLKPANIKASELGHYKVLDLGLATEFRRQENWSFCGTPAYSSPEQAAGLPCDGRADQYALAVIAYEMLTGRRPFLDPDPRVLLDLHRSGDAPWPRVDPSVLDSSICSSLMRGLDKVPGNRYPTCEAFAAALGCRFLSVKSPSRVLLAADANQTQPLLSRLRALFYLSAERRGTTCDQVMLTEDSLWIWDRGEARRRPLEDVISLKKSKHRAFSLFGVLFLPLKPLWVIYDAVLGSPTEELPGTLIIEYSGRLDVPTDRLSLNAKDMVRLWTSILGLKSDLSEPTREGPDPEVFVEPRPIAVLRHRPAWRYQVLGSVEDVRENRWAAWSGLQLRAAIMGADAIVEAQDEKLYHAFTTDWRYSGVAIRAVDRDARRELTTRWYGEKSAYLCEDTWVLTATCAISVAILLKLGILTPSTSVSYYCSIVLSCLILFSVAAHRLRWPQLLRAVAVLVASSAVTTSLLQFSSCLINLRMYLDVTKTVFHLLPVPPEPHEFKKIGIVWVVRLAIPVVFLAQLRFGLRLARAAWGLHGRYLGEVPPAARRGGEPRSLIGGLSTFASIALTFPIAVLALNSLRSQGLDVSNPPPKVDTRASTNHSGGNRGVGPALPYDVLSDESDPNDDPQGDPARPKDSREEFVLGWISFSEETYGHESTEVAEAMDALGQYYCGQSRLREAEPVLRGSVELWEKAGSPDDPRIAAARSRYTELLRRLGQSSSSGIK